MRRIHEHDAAKIARGEGAVDVAGVALPDQVRQVARVINVRVAQHHGVHLLGVEWKTTIALDGFLAAALEQTAFEQQPLAVDLEKIHRTGRGAGCAEAVDLHGAIVLRVACYVKKMPAALAAISRILPLKPKAKVRNPRSERRPMAEIRKAN